eukprot:g8107.t1
MGGETVAHTRESHTRITCTIPAGGGAGVRVEWTNIPVQSGYNATYLFSYLPPAIDDIRPARQTAGQLLTLTGRNFGKAADQVNVRIANQTCPIETVSHTQVTCRLPVGQGTWLPVYISVTGREAGLDRNAKNPQRNDVPARFDYNAPVLTSVLPANGSTTGGELITLAGQHFSLNGSVLFSLLCCTIAADSPCRVLSRENDRIVLTTPAGPVAESAAGPENKLVVEAGGQLSSESVLFSWNRPQITSLSLYAPLQKLIVIGTNFGSRAGLVTTTVGEDACPAIQLSVNHTTFSCDLPKKWGARPVVVGRQGQLSAPVIFNYPLPRVTSPASELTGSTAGGYLLTLAGQNFGDGGVRFVRIDGNECVWSVANGRWSSTEIICAVPAGEGSARDLIVSVDGFTSFPVPFSYFPPKLSTVTPLAGPTGGGITVTLTGSDFGRRGTVLIGGNVCIQDNPLWYDQGRIVCVLPAGSTANANLNRVEVRVPGLASPTGTTYLPGDQTLISPAIFFNYTNPLLDGLICPLPGRACPFLGKTTGAGDVSERLVLTGSSFDEPKGTILLNNTAVHPSNIYSWSHTRIEFLYPAGAGRNLPVSVLTINNKRQVGPPANFSYLPPRITNLQPNLVLTGGGNRRMTVNGDQFGPPGSSIVEIGSESIPWLVCPQPVGETHTHSRIVCQVPENQGPPRFVRVITAGQVSNFATFLYAAPAIESITPTSGPTQGGVLLTLSGQSMGTSLAVITVGGRACPVVQCTLPTGSGKGQEVRLVVDGVANNNVPVFFAYEPPVLLSVSPFSNLPSAGGTTLNITGRNLGLRAGPSEPLVALGPARVLCPVTTAQHNTLTCVLPSGEGANLSVYISLDGQADFSGNVTISYAGPTVSAVRPNTGPPVGNVVLNISGSNFGLQPQVLIAGTICPRLAVSPLNATSSWLTCRLAAGGGVGLPVQLIAGGQSSFPASLMFFTYFKPVITGLNPRTGPTSGLTEVRDSYALTVTGGYFSEPGQPFRPAVTLVDPAGLTPTRSCPLVRWADGEIVCALPAGEGTGLEVAVSLANQSGTSRPILFSYLPPQLSGLSPRTGPTQGSLLQISGRSFGTRGTVKIGNFSCVPDNLQLDWSHTFITCRLGAGYGTALAITITAGGQSASNSSLAFSYSAPQIFELIPDTGMAVGSVAGGNVDYIRIRGTSFDDAPGVVTVHGEVVQLKPGSWNHTSVEFLYPPGSGLAEVRLTTRRGYQSDPAIFRYGSPTVSSLQPAAVTTGGGPAGSRVLTVYGAGFGGVKTNVNVSVAGRPCPVLTVEQTKLTCTPPEGQGVDKPVQVLIGEVASTGDIYLDYSDPVLTGIRPSVGPTTGGFALTLTGNSLGTTRGSVTVGGEACPITSQQHERVVCTAPPGLGSGRAVQLVLANEVDQSSNVLTFSYSPPIIDSISPAFGPTLGGTLLTIDGQNLGQVAPVLVRPEVQIGGRPCLGLTLLSPLRLTCITPAGTGADLSVRVFLLSQASSPSPRALFSYQAPVILTMECLPSSANPADPNCTSPTAGESSGGYYLRLFGTDFGPAGEALVEVGPSRAPVLLERSINHTLLVVQVPPGEGKHNPVRVIAAGQASNASLFQFSYAPPFELRLEPNNGPTRGSAVVTVTGRSFGLSGQLTIGQATCDLVAPSAYTHRRLVCRAPEGQGRDVSVRLTTASGSNTSVVPYHYQAPSIEDLSPNHASTEGGTQLIITGNNLGLTGTIVLGGRPCPLAAPWTHEALRCTIPAGVGQPVRLQLNVSGQIAVFSGFNYDSPVLTGLVPPSGPTEGNVSLTLLGRNFGPAGAVVAVLVGQVQAVVISNTHTTAMTGEGSALVVSLPVFFPFLYATPQLLRVSGCPEQVENRTANCPVSGGVVITLTGANFGSPALSANNNNKYLSVSIGTDGWPCGDLRHWSHTVLTCVLPPGKGYDVVVRVRTLDNADVSADLLSYTGPVVSPGSLRLYQAGPGSLVQAGQVEVNDTRGGQWLEFRGTGFGNNPAGLVAQFGIPDQPNTYRNCAVQASLTNSSRAVCQLAAGIGHNLSLRVTVPTPVGPQLSRWSGPIENSLSYPAPRLSPGTLRLPDGSASTLVAGTESEGQLLIMSGHFFGLAAEAGEFLRVWYGPAGGNKTYPCLEVALQADHIGPLLCRTSPGQGGPHVFQVTALNALGPEGTDGFLYPLLPTISKVRGCQSSFGDVTTGCPTTGAPARLRITGTGFASGHTSVVIGNALCLDVQVVNASFLTCNLPPGTGVLRKVEVVAGSLFSAARPLVSYQCPELLHITGCPTEAPNGLATSDCPREVGPAPVMITLSGRNFGLPVPLVFVSGQPVQGVVIKNVDTAVTFLLPQPGEGLGESVLLVQQDGEPSLNRMHINYKQCPAGSIEDPLSRGCLICGNGTFTSLPGQFRCELCQPGLFSPVPNATQCQKCPLGFYSLRLAATSCLPCVAGRAASVAGATSCYECPLGKIGPNASLVECEACRPGYFNNQAGATICLACEPGLYASEPGTFSCYFCPPGRIVDGYAQSTCQLCPIGSFRDLSSDFCQDCPAGTFSALNGSAACLSCAAGRFNNESRSSDCKVCPPGYFSGLDIRSDLNASVGGGTATESDSVLLTKCRECEPGRYAPRPDQANSCLRCPAGRYQDRTAEQICLVCRPGFFQNAAGSTECQSCRPGFFSANFESIGCAGCPPGRFQPNNASTACLPCPVGTYNDREGQSTCPVCPPGTFHNVSSGGLLECYSCEPGRVSRTVSAQTCEVCPTGTYATGATSNKTGAITCKNCPLGRFGKAEGQSMCTACPVGTFLNSSGLSSCQECEVGSFNAIAGASSCEQCAPGRYASSGGNFECLPCDVGFFNNASGQAKCEMCPSGSFSNELGSTECGPCPAGSYLPAGTGSTDGVCLKCGVGTYSNTPSASGCLQCGPGKYQDQPGSTICKLCPPGNFTVKNKQNRCSGCPLGKYAGQAGSTACISCRPGFLADQIGTAACLPCPAGLFTPDSGAQSCGMCSPGTIQNITGQTSCFKCSIGRAQPEAGKTSCPACAPGRYGAAAGQADCLACPAGTAAGQNGTEQCPGCEPGYFTFAPGAASCAPCLAGRFSSSPFTISCLSCPAGFFSRPGQEACEPCEPGRADRAGQAAYTCSNCSAGYSQPAAGQLSCLACAPGRHAPRAGLVDCLFCPAGKGSGATEGAQDCQDCQPGYFAAIPGVASCLLCSHGRYSNRTGAQDCEACAAGYAAPNSAQRLCQPCAPGYVSVSGAVQCDECPKGSFTSQQGSPRCDKCPRGRYAGREGSSVCELCPAGTTAGAEGQEACIACRPGRFLPGRNTTAANQTGSDSGECQLCPEGRFADRPGQLACSPCPAGFFTSVVGQVLCAPCKEGRFTNETGKLECRDCPPGLSAETAGSPICTPCTAGRFGTLFGQLACTNCPAGTASTLIGNSQGCTECPLGRFARETGRTDCAFCPDGTYAPRAGLSSCALCPAGLSRNSSHHNATSCVDCAAGKYQSREGAASCDLCPPGKFRSAAGLGLKCQDCNAGFATADFGSTICQACEPGRYQDRSAQPSCIACQPGSSRAAAGQASCQPCGLGRYTNNTGSSVCAACESGSYAPVSGLEVCWPAPVGSFVDVPGARTATPCPLATYSPDQGASACLACPAGRFNDVAQQAECQPCQPGYFGPARSSNINATENTGLIRCAATPPGYYNRVQGAEAPVPCAPGHFQNSSGQQVCRACPAGEEQLLSGQIECSPCPAGHFGNASGQPQCPACPAGRYMPDTGYVGDTCLPCSPGRYSQLSGQLSCLVCPLGTFGNISALPACPACAPGFFQNMTGQTDCLPCAAGSFVSAPGQSQCLPCPIGTASAVPGQAFCPDCPGGQFNALSGQLNCQNCPVRTFSVSPQECQPCLAGRFGAREGLAECEPCELGKHQSETGQALCEDCAVGHVASLPGSLECRPCSAGEYTDTNGSSTCTPCSPGLYNEQLGATLCLPCPYATFSYRPGSERCQTCPEGKFNAESAQSVCQDCLPGYFSASSAVTSCLPCQRGRFAALPGLRNCLACPPASFTNRTGRSACQECGKGKFRTESGGESCQDCPHGTYAEKPGSEVCATCPDGQFIARIGATSCEQCPLGTSSKSNSSELRDSCEPCRPGLFGPRIGLSNCLPCPVATFASGTGSMACLSCPAGLAGPIPGQERCFDCEPGRQAEMPGLATCNLCARGRASPSFGQITLCGPCEPGRFASGEGQTECDPCPVGQFSDAEGRTSCQTCAAGSFTDSPGSLKCQSCSPGRATSFLGSAECQECVPGRVAPREGALYCMPCSAGRFGSSGGMVECDECPPAGTYQPLEGQATCILCPAGRASSVSGAEVT